MADPHPAEQRFHQVLQELVSRRKYDLWFSNLHIGSTGPSGVTLVVRDPFHREWIHSYYMDVVRRAASQSLETDAPVHLVVGGSNGKQLTEDAVFAVQPIVDPLPDASVTNHDYFSQNSDVVLNQKYSFENFVVGSSNQLAHAAALAVADAPAGSYNPLFLHGAVGLGKTHLLQAICHKAMRSGRTLRVLYLSSETFVNQFIAAIERGDLSKFRYKYRNVDLLLIDDIHLLANKERTQEEFFHTFNTLYNEGRQIVLSSDSPPSEIPTLRERLISRFKWGLVAEIAAPGYETRMAILRRKARDRGIELPEDVLAYLAENIDRNIRELEGAVTKVVGYAQLTSRTIDHELARQALDQSDDGSRRTIVSVDEILEVVCQHFGVRTSDLNGRKRTQSIVLPRHIAMYLTRKLTPLSLMEIAARFGGRDHSTILYACTRIEEKIGKDSKFEALVNGLVSRLRA